MNRETWLHNAIKELTPLFPEDLPTVRVSVGWPHGGRASTIGQCFPGAMAKDSVGQIFISPVVEDGTQVLAILVHELIHAINHSNGDSGHGKVFSVIAKPLGLVGKMTSTVAGPELLEKLEAIMETLGEYPHAALTTTKRGSTRSGKVIKLYCRGGEDYIVSISKSRLETFGTPACPCHDTEMSEEKF